MNKIIITEYSSDWPMIFEGLKRVYNDALQDLICDVHHVDSTAVPGLSAKPVIDIDLVIEYANLLNSVILKLKTLGYTYEGEMELNTDGRSKELQIKRL